MMIECVDHVRNCLFDKELSNIGFVYVDGVEKKCSSGLILSLIPDLDFVIHYTPWYPLLAVSLKIDRKVRIGLFLKQFYYSKSVLPVRYDDYLNEQLADLDDEGVEW